MPVLGICLGSEESRGVQRIPRVRIWLLPGLLRIGFLSRVLEAAIGMGPALAQELDFATLAVHISPN